MAPEVQRGLLGPITIGDEPRNEIDHKSCHTAMPRVLDLADVLQWVVDGLNEDSLTEEQFVPEAHETVVHVLTPFGQQFESLPPEDIVQRLGDLPPIPQELANKPLGETGDGAAGIDMAWSQLQGQAFPLIIDDEMQFEAIDPTHRRLAPGCPAVEDLVAGHAAVMTHGQGRGVDEGKTRTPAFAGVEITTQGHQCLRH